MSTAHKVTMQQHPPGNHGHGSFQTARKEGFQPANNNKRVIAFILDAIISGVLGQLILKFVLEPVASKVTFGTYLTFGVSFLVIPTLYWVVLTLQMGATPGKKMMGLKIVNEDHSLKLSFGQLVIRELFGRMISGVPLCLGYIWVSFNKERKTWHDMIAKTRVVDYR